MKYPGNKFNQYITERPVYWKPWDINEGNWSRQINGELLHAHRFEQSNVHTFQSNLQIQDNPYQNSNGILNRYITDNPKIGIDA